MLGPSALGHLTKLLARLALPYTGKQLSMKLYDLSFQSITRDFSLCFLYCIKGILCGYAIWSGRHPSGSQQPGPTCVQPDGHWLSPGCLPNGIAWPQSIPTVLDKKLWLKVTVIFVQRTTFLATTDQSHRYRRHQAACREPAGSYDKTTRTVICFEHKTQYLLIHAPYTRIVVFWHISNIPPMISQSQISCNTPKLYIAAIFVRYCYTTGSWLL